MVVGIDDAVISWLVASTGDRLILSLREEPAQAALRKVVVTSMNSTVDLLGAHLKPEQADHLRAVLLEQGPTAGARQVHSSGDLEVALREWLAEIDRPEFDGPGYLQELGIDLHALASELTNQILQGIEANARSGGALQPLADGLRHDKVVSLATALTSRRAEPTRDADTRPRGLPGASSSFTGREQMLAQLSEWVEANDPSGSTVAVLAVDGMAGVGKTELVLQLAHRHKLRYPDGQYFINLHGFTQGITPMAPDAALGELLRQAGIANDDIPLDLAGRQNRWSAVMADRRALIVLDNAQNAAQIQALMPQSAGCLVMITSRLRLAGPYENLTLDVLFRQEAALLVGRIVGQERCADTQSVEGVVDLVGCLPLAVMMIAGRMRRDRLLTVSDLATDLADSRGRLDVTSPHGIGVRAAFDVSMQSLTNQQRRAFRLLGVHPGPTVGPPQFAALADISVRDATGILRELDELNLLGSAVSTVGHRRYEMHDLVRDFAREESERHFSSAEEAAAHARLIDWYTIVGRQLNRMLDHTQRQPTVSLRMPGLRLADAVQARQWIIVETDNVMGLAGHAVGPGGAEFCRRFGRRLQYLDRQAPAMTLFTIASGIHSNLGDIRGRADCLDSLGHLAQVTGDLRGAAGYFEQAANGHYAAGNRAGYAKALDGLGTVLRDTGNHVAARQHLLTAVRSYRELGIQDGVANALLGLAKTALAAGDPTAASEDALTAAELFKKLNNKGGYAAVKLILGKIAINSGDHDAAHEHYQVAAQVNQRIGDQLGYANALLGLADNSLSAGEHSAANRHAEAAAAIYYEIGNRRGEANSSHLLGRVALATGDSPLARDRLFDALEIYLQLNDLLGVASSHLELGQLAYMHGRSDVARAEWRTALAIYQQLSHPLATTVRGWLDELDQP